MKKNGFHFQTCRNSQQIGNKKGDVKKNPEKCMFVDVYQQMSLQIS